MTQSKRIAVTGGIGSGKSTLCEILRKRGYAVFSCDEIAAELWREDGFLRALALRFPACCRGEKIDRALLSAHVFSDAEARAALDALTHPAIMERLLKRMDGAVSFAEVPLLYEGGYERLFSGVIALRRADRARIDAVCARDGLTEEEVQSRMRAQMDAAALAEKGCFLLENDGTIADLEQKTEAALAYFGVI